MYGFQFANAINFTIALGTPMVLTGKFLGAGEALIGVMLAFTPLLNLLQVLASNTAERLGYKRMVLAGWGARSFMMMLAVPLPLLHGRTLFGWAVPDSLLLGVLVGLLFLFILIRGVTCVVWVPWVSQVVPEAQRGRYFGWDQTCINGGALAILIASGFFLGNDPAGTPGWKYAALFTVSWLAGWLSVQFLKPVPCTMPPSAAAKARRSWGDLRRAYREVWRHKPFRRMARFQALNSLAWAAYGGFLTVFLKDQQELGEGYILGISAVGTLGTILTSILWGRFSDRFGSRPTMRLAGIGQIAVLAVWGLAAAGVIRMGVGQLFLLSAVFGIVSAAMTIPLLKLYMASFPEHEMTVAVTLNSVLTSLCGAAAPLLWGPVLEILKHQPCMVGGWLRPFTVFFGATALMTVLAQLALGRIRDTRSMPTLQVVGTVLLDWPRQLFSDLGDTLSGPRRQR